MQIWGAKSAKHFKHCKHCAILTSLASLHIQLTTNAIMWSTAKSVESWKHVLLLLLVYKTISAGDGRFTGRGASATANLIPDRVVFPYATAEHSAGHYINVDAADCSAFRNRPDGSVEQVLVANQGPMCHDVCIRTWLAISGKGSFLDGILFLYFSFLSPSSVSNSLLSGSFSSLVDLLLPLIGVSRVSTAWFSVPLHSVLMKVWTRTFW